MSTIDCKAFWNQLEQWMEGERSADAQAHLRGCPECRNIVDDLDGIRVAARSLEAETPAPPDRIWIALRAQLEQEGLIHADPSGWTSTIRHWFDGVFSAVPRPALAGAYLAALIAVGISFAGPGYKHANATLEPTQPLMAQLNSAEQDAMSSTLISDPVVSASLRKNLAIVDNYIALCEKSVQEDPENEIARDYLYGAYQQKADLLAQMTERGDDR